MQQLILQLEALLFVAARPVGYRDLAKLTHTPVEDVMSALEELNSELEGRGVRIILGKHDAEMATAPELAELVEGFLQQESATPLSKPALETLAIILHQQPVTKHQIDEIRGIASDQTIRGLLHRGLIEETGPSKEPGKPMQYATTTALLRQAGADSLSTLTQPLEVPDAS